MAGQLRDIYAWIISTLMADATITTTYGVTGVWSIEAPENPSYPYILLQKQTGGHKFALGNVHTMSDDWVMIKVTDFGEDGGDRARRICTRIAELIENQAPTIPGGYVYVIRRQNDIDYVTAEASNQHYWQVGSVYTVQYF